MKHIDSVVHCAFPVPSGLAWYGFALALTDRQFWSYLLASWALYLLLLFGLLGIALPIAGKLASTKYKPYIPNVHAMGIAFLTFPYFGATMLLGALVAALWRKRRPTTAASFSECVAAGLVAGEGVAGISGALLTLAGVTARICFGLPGNGFYSC